MEDICLNRRERERIARKNDIMKAAAAVFAQKGYCRATLDEIAEKAEFSKGAIYTYFKSKSDLLCRLVEEGFKDLIDHVENVITDEKDFREQLRNVLDKIFIHLDNNKDFFRIVWEQRLEIRREIYHNESEYDKELLEGTDILSDQIAAIFEKAIKGEQINKVFPAKFLSSFFIGSTIGIIHFWLGQYPDQSLVGKTDLIMKLFWEGVGVRENVA